MGDTLPGGLIQNNVCATVRFIEDDLHSPLEVVIKTNKPDYVSRRLRNYKEAFVYDTVLCDEELQKKLNCPKPYLSMMDVTRGYQVIIMSKLQNHTGLNDIVD